MISAHKCIIALLIAFLVVKLSLLVIPHPVGWDEAVYIGMGKHIYSGGEHGLWEDIRPPGLPLVLGMAWTLFPSSVIPLSEFILVAFSLGLVVLTYLLGKKIYDESVGIFAAALLMLSPIFFSSSSEILSSIPAAFFSLFALYLLVLNKSFLAGLSVGAAFLFRFPHGLTLAGLVLFLIPNRSAKKIGLLLLGFGIILLPFLLFNYFAYRDITGSALDALFRPFLFAVQHQSNPFHPESFFFYGKELLLQQALFALALVGLFSRRALPVAVLAVLYFAYYTLIPNKQERFLLDFLPYLSILAGVGIVRTYRALNLVLRPVFVILCVFFIVQVVSADYALYNSRPLTESSLVPFFSSLPLDTVLTFTPLPAAYSDVRLIPLYDNPTIALKIYDQWKGKAQYLLYFSDYYPCPDGDCITKKNEMNLFLPNQTILSRAADGDKEYILYRIS